MALGETIGFVNQVSQRGLEGQSISPVWRDLLGDPTLRMHVVKPASNVNATGTTNNMTITWQASNENPADIVGYHVYRAASVSDTFVRVTPSTPVTGTSFIDNTGGPSDVYMVRPIKQEVTASGTYFNSGRGALSTD